MRNITHCRVATIVEIVTLTVEQFLERVDGDLWAVERALFLLRHYVFKNFKSCFFLLLLVDRE